MLENFGLHEIVWNRADERFAEVLVASPGDAQGRGIALTVKDGTTAVNLTGAHAYLVWRHRRTGERGTREFTAVDAAHGKMMVYYPAAMAGAMGTVDAQITLSLGDGRFVSTRDFVIRVERVLVDGEPREDGFTLFIGAIDAYERASRITYDAADAANEAAAGILAAAERGDFDGEDGEDGAPGPAGADGQDGADGEDGISCTHTWNGTVLTVTSASGTSSADLKGAKGDTGEAGATGATGPAGPQGETGAQGPVGPAGPAGADGQDGADGADGEDGVSCTHSWSGTVLTVTSASGTSSADLKGPKGDDGADGQDGQDGADGEDGVGVPAGGSAGQVLAKKSATDYDTEWTDAGGGTEYTFAEPLSADSDNEVSIDDGGYAKLGSANVFTAGQSLCADGAHPNTVGAESIALGASNTFQSFKRSFVMGSGNSLASSMGMRDGAFVVGSNNTLSMGSFVVGGNNTLNSGGMMVNGDRNGGFGSGSFCSGNNNTMGANRSAALGSYLSTGRENQTAVGAYNQSSSTALFLVGNGTSYGDRRNAFAVEADGTSSFAGAVSGVTPTASAHLTTKAYVDGAIADAIAALDDLSEVMF